MEWLQDDYILQAADVAAAWAGRGWNWGTNKWENISGRNLSLSTKSKHRIKSIQAWVYLATGEPKQGIVIPMYIVADPLATGFTIRLEGKSLQGGNSLAAWSGNEPFLAGALWRINAGGAVATDRVVCAIGYE
jgi:hypothetical protein